ncbi:uncharacterized protein LOC133178157 [Saccostrea echinata]|uniref:uncharacterized protein LOC133178157 n=1 Tax=Saccostrea echinata TaxID=191078 RepID=UPI002A810E12|nr:uncharacterized protein LOC133178157 [Saccostrea echinata]
MIERTDGKVICNKCRHRCSSMQKKSATCSTGEKIYLPSSVLISSSPDRKKRATNIQSPPSVILPIHSTVKSHAYCVLCKKPGPKLIVVSTETRFKVFISHNVLIPSGARCCPSHFTNGRLTYESLEIIPGTKDHSFVNRTTIMELLQQLRDEANAKGRQRLDFDDPEALNDDDYQTLTGLSKVDFDDILTYARSTDIRPSKSRSIRTCIAILLTKLKTSLDNKMLAVMFNMSKPQIRRAVSTARQALCNSFVPQHLGFQHVTRDTIIQEHTRPLAKELFAPSFADEKAILVLDGTYIYVQKSTNFAFQRRSFSMQKHRHLVKPMMIVSTTGYIIAAIGPYLADGKNSDPKILNHIFATNVQEIKSWIKEDDIMIVDRAFRDSAGVLSEIGINMDMPSFLKKGQKQHSAEEANSSRLITKIRWVVESVNARIKTWRYLGKQLPNSQIPCIGDYVRIVSAICNKYRSPISTGNEESDLNMAAKMRHLLSKSNLLQQEVESHGLDKKSHRWTKLDEATADLDDFPGFTEDEVRELTLGVYQVKLAKRYSQEHTNLDGTYEIWIDKQLPGLLIAKLQSRHISNCRYQCWIRYSEGAVTSWYCRCRSGARVVGACAHITSVIWYLARHEHVSLQMSKNWLDSLEGAAHIPEAIDESGSEAEVTDGRKCLF